MYEHIIPKSAANKSREQLSEKENKEYLFLRFETVLY